MPVRSYYNATFQSFLEAETLAIIGELSRGHHFALDQEQKAAWLQQISILKLEVAKLSAGHLFLEFIIPRMGKRADAVLIFEGLIFVVEFKVGAERFDRHALEQVEDYALDLKNFHEGSHALPIVPVLVATNAHRHPERVKWAADNVGQPLLAGAVELAATILAAAADAAASPFDLSIWMRAGYRPTPTIVEAAKALYESHRVEDISRSDAGARNLRDTADCISEIIERSKANSRKSICFVTGTPGSGKTLAGLNIATKRSDEHADEHAVFLSGNGPLVIVLREALARDQSHREGISKAAAERKVRSFIQNIHHFRDHYVASDEIPLEKVTIFDEAQRAWTREQVSKFMQSKRGHAGFDQSEPSFLIGVMDRHEDWCTVVCLVGGGQEINTGEAGLSEWIESLESDYSTWDVYVSSRIVEPEFGDETAAAAFLALPHVSVRDALHLAVSMRSFRAEELSQLVGAVVDDNPNEARKHADILRVRYPIVLTRSLEAARDWLRKGARGSERIGLVASSGAHRLRPEGIHIKSSIDASNWFLNDRADVRSSYYLEEVASEFDIQGLELDWVCVCWDADFRYQEGGWSFHNFKGTKWQSVNDVNRRRYLKNAYRVLLTRARQGMVIFVPLGDEADLTRPKRFYDETYAYLRACGLLEL